MPYRIGGQHIVAFFLRELGMLSLEFLGIQKMVEKLGIIEQGKFACQSMVQIIKN
jgi:hypothetical protein